ncbi:MAG: DUF3341 domain-containing protein [Phycisphaeraceae bacterium]|nr:hypothetical protein [Phycisphaerae bacterium]MCP3859097.1 DUF3341 domain-containing protein [Phycisphaeraceae bacterium]MCP4013802.1 DUF3341 domain-containing protein [Phycisphaeraceae bacterium]MCP4067326.1 DUF3341 domain-containing protein [Phycisphaeraceae bacterium]MCP4797515.1 DUF3341 domain-containing protein [Phycisphaeraceae bacterium]
MTTFETPTPTVDPAETTETPKLHALIAEFETPGEVLKAAEKVREAGYRWWDCCTPFPVHGMDGAMGIKPTILPVMVFFAGLAGLISAFVLQAFTNSTGMSIWALVWVTGYPYLISGKPLLSIPAFIPVMFELTILFAALTCVFGMFGMNGLPRLHHPLLANDRFRRVTDDRFYIVIEARDPKFFRSRTEAFLGSIGAVAVEEVQD